MPRTTTIASALLLLSTLPLSGCGAVAVIHDTMIGPISPAGRIEPVISGRSFQVGVGGITVARTNEPRLRAYPPDIGARFRGFDGLLGGVRFAVQGQSFLSHQVFRSGRPVPIDRSGDLVVGETSPAKAVELLGPPSLWLRRASGDLIAWGSQNRQHVLIRIGPGAASQFIPIPFVGNAKVDLGFGSGDSARLVLVFSPEGTLAAIGSR